MEGNPTRNSNEIISLNSFVKSVQMLISYLNKYNIIGIDWKNDKELNEIINDIKDIFKNLGCSKI